MVEKRGRRGGVKAVVAAIFAVVALTLLAGCAGAAATPTPLPASIVRPVQPTPNYARTLPRFSLDDSTRTPVFVPTRDAEAAAQLAAPLPTSPSRRSLLQALLMNQPPSAIGIALGGATILAAPGGSAVGSVPAADTVTVTGRSADGAWLAIYTDDATAGWVPAGALVLYGDEDLTTVDRAFSPAPVATLLADAMQPLSTPLADMVAALPAIEAKNAARATAIAEGGTNAFLASGTPQAPAPGTAAGVVEDGAASASEQSMQIGAVSAAGNLNLRGSPSANGAILASLPAQSQLVVLGRTAQGDWLQVRAPAGDGWVDARFIELTGALDGLPVVQ